jgi:hypothetical protein
LSPASQSCKPASERWLAGRVSPRQAAENGDPGAVLGANERA